MNLSRDPRNYRLPTAAEAAAKKTEIEAGIKLVTDTFNLLKVRMEAAGPEHKATLDLLLKAETNHNETVAKIKANSGNFFTPDWPYSEIKDQATAGSFINATMIRLR